MDKKRMSFEDVSSIYNKLFRIWLYSSLLLTLWIIVFYFIVGFADIYGGEDYATLYNISKLNWSDVKSLGAIGYYRQLMNKFILVDLIIWACSTLLIIIHRLMPIRIIIYPLTITIYLIKIAAYITALIMLIIVPYNAPGLSSGAWRLLLTTFIVQIALPFVELIFFAIIGFKRTI